MTKQPISIQVRGKSNATSDSPSQVDRLGPPLVECLERRWLLAGNAQLAGGILTVTGTESIDNIQVWESNGRIIVSINSVVWGDDWAEGDVSRIDVNALGGNDTINIADTNQNAIIKPTILNGGAGRDDLDGGDGNDTMYGGSENDILKGVGGVNTYYGEGGDDDLVGGDDVDYMYGGADNDTLSGGNGNDQMHGDGGLDRLDGGADNDDLFGGDEDDVLDGNSGSDILDGGAGDDHCYARDFEVDDIQGGDEDDFDTLHTHDSYDNYGGFEVIL